MLSSSPIDHANLRKPSKKSPFTRGLPYVAISRATDLDKVALLSPHRTDHLKIKFNTDEEI